MANGNSVTLVGNVTRDPELRFTPNGQAIATFGLAVNRVWNDKQSNERKEAVSFFDIVCWAAMAENAGQSLSKGARVLVTGRLEQRSWETQDGEKRSKIEVVAEEVGPSLRWATAEIQKNDRRAPSDGSPPVSAYDSSGAPGGDSSMASPAGVSNGPAPGAPAPAPAPAYDYGEEPF